jgi:tyrosine-protein kinase Etk/Wzc
MELKTERPLEDNLALANQPHSRSHSDALWQMVGVLYARRRLIGIVTGSVLVISLIISLLMPRWYMAEARVLQPEAGATSMAGLIETVMPGARALLGKKAGDYTRYLAILTSRSMMDRAVERFDLETVYETQGTQDPRGRAIKALRGNTDFRVSLEYDYLAVQVLDRDPQRAADMANYFVAQLNEAHARLSSQNARHSRIFIEERLRETEAGLDSARARMQAFQEQYGVLELGTQASVFLESVAQAKAGVAQADVRYQMLLRQYGQDNAQVQAARDARDITRAQMAAMLGGREELMPVALRNMPAVGRRYTELMQEVMIQTKIMELVRPLYEQARFQEQNEALAVQVVDEAVVPVLKAKPKRAFIVLGATLSALILVIVFLLVHARLVGHRTYLADRLRQVSAASV